MPVFNANDRLTYCIPIGDSIDLFAAADTLTAPADSIVVCIQQPGMQVRGVRQFTINFASSPTDVVKIYGSNIAPTAAGVDPNGFLLYTSTNTQADQYEDGNAFIFYWAHLTSQSGGGALTVRMLQV
jgi:hypothetical protein